METQFKSFFAAFFVAFLVLWVFIKSFKTTILVLNSKCIALSYTGIFMSLLDIPLDISTAMITPIMLGIAMDDTIHLVYKYRRSKTIKGTPEHVWTMPCAIQVALVFYNNCFGSRVFNHQFQCSTLSKGFWIVMCCNRCNCINHRYFLFTCFIKEIG